MRALFVLLAVLAGSAPGVGWVEHEVDSDIAGGVSAVAEDLDGDDDLDLAACGQYSHFLNWYENDGAGDFVRHQVAAEYEGAHCVYATDVDGDSDPDWAFWGRFLYSYSEACQGRVKIPGQGQG